MLDLTDQYCRVSIPAALPQR